MLGLIAILLLMMLAFTYVGVGSTAYWATGVVVLLSTNLAALDMNGRIVADIAKTSWLRDSKTWTESRLYFLVVWAMVVFGSAILLSGVSQPLLLLIIASALNSLVMFVYSVLLMRPNRGMLPATIGLKGVRYVALLWAVLFYGGFSIYLLIDQFGKLF